MKTHPAPRRGFSLVELMFSMAIGSIVLLLAASMLASSGEGYERVGGNIASEREARAVMSQLASDLSTAKFHKDSVFNKSTGNWARDTVGFLSLQPSEAQTTNGRLGDLCSVNYYLKDLTIGGKTVRCLMRGFRESSETFKGVIDGNMTTLFAEKPGVDEPVAFGVVAFEARPRTRDATGKWIDWDTSTTKGPQALDVKLVVARRDLVGRLTTAQDWNGGGSGANLLGDASKPERNKDLEIYATTLRFGNHATP